MYLFVIKGSNKHDSCYVWPDGHIYCSASAEQINLLCARLLRIFVADNRIEYMTRKKRPSSRPRGKHGKNQTPDQKAMQKELNLKRKERSGGKKKSKGKKEHFNKEELTGTVSMTREGYGFVEVPDRDNDVFVPQHKMRGALNGDIVKVLTTKA